MVAVSLKKKVFSSRRRHTRYIGDWSSDVCSSDLEAKPEPKAEPKVEKKPEVKAETKQPAPDRKSVV